MECTEVCKYSERGKNDVTVVFGKMPNGRVCTQLLGPLSCAGGQGMKITWLSVTNPIFHACLATSVLLMTGGGSRDLDFLAEICALQTVFLGHSGSHFYPAFSLFNQIGL